MPTLKMVAACEKVIYDQDGPVSIISLFQAMQFRLQAAPLPERAIAPNQWSIFTLWDCEPQELGIEFVQVARVLAPDGSLFVENEFAFVNSNPDRHQQRIRTLLNALPIWQEGTLEIEIYLKGDDLKRGYTSFKIEYLAQDDTSPIVQLAAS